MQTFELRALTQQSKLLGPMMRYIMLEVSQQMTTEAPMFLLLDDAAIAWLAPKGDARRQGGAALGAQNHGRAGHDWLQTTAKRR